VDVPQGLSASSPRMEVRWEQIVAPRSAYRDNYEAVEALEAIRRRMASAAYQTPEGVDITKLQVQVHGWTDTHQHAGPHLRDVFLTTPLGKISRILQNEQGLYMVRVLERRRKQYAVQAATANLPVAPGGQKKLRRLPPVE